MRLLSLIVLLSLSPWALAAPTGVYVQRVESQPFADTLEALGTLRANESIELSANITERIVSIHFQDGERVAAGKVLVEMNAAEEKALRQEQFLVVDEASKQYERVKTLAKDGLAPKSLLDEKRREFLAAQARLDGIDARMQDLTIIAPFAGVLGIRNMSVGTLVKPGDEITTLDDDHIMKLDFSVPSTYLPVLRNGLKIEATAKALGDKVFRGEVASIDSRVDPVTRSVKVRALIPNADFALRPGLLMSVELYKNPRQTLVVGEDALIPEAREHFVMKVESSGDKLVVRKTPVTLGSRTPGLVEVLDGLQEGDRIVTHGTVKLRDGAEISVLATQQIGERLPSLLKQRSGN